MSKTGFLDLKKNVRGISVMEIAGAIVEDIRKNFEDSTTPYGTPLAALSSSRITQKTIRGFPLPHKPLVASTQLYNSIYAKSIRNDEAHVLVKSKRERTADNPIPKKKGAKASKIPTNPQLLAIHENSRPVFGLSNRVKITLKERLQAIGTG